MKPKYRNVFLLLGIAAVVTMLLTFDMSWDEILHHIRRAGIWLPAVIVLWIPIYIINARAWQVILRNDAGRELSFWRILKYTISGYALNGVTPVGVLGGEPYRILELTPYVGAEKATSSVILYAMMHIFSHFCFWTFSVVLFLFVYTDRLTPLLVILLLLIALFCALGIYFFLLGYRNGLARRALLLFGRLPFIGHHIRSFAERHAESIEKVDCQIAQLHAQRRTTFYYSLFLEFMARMFGCLEVMFILFIFTSEVSFWDCVLIQAFSSLVGNLIFFIPMQMGAREGGLALIADTLHIPAGYGVLTGLIIRLREFFWTTIGLLLIRIGNEKQ